MSRDGGIKYRRSIRIEKRTSIQHSSKNDLLPTQYRYASLLQAEKKNDGRQYNSNLQLRSTRRAYAANRSFEYEKRANERRERE